MAEQLTSNTEALRLFFTEDIYLIPNQVAAPLAPIVEVLPVSFNFEGENSRNVLILVSDVNFTLSTVPGTALLWKIVAAIKLTNKECAVLNYANYPDQSFADLAAFFKPQLLLSFGVPPETLGLPAQQTEVLGQQNGVKAIFSATLDALELDINIKKALWKSLQQLTLS
ncbi:DNA polymerase III psi subunit [Pedobacter sp. CG_S7]|uniref:hypothetical protein n=1 Tax=Pedobacter sp. CG_S7 TaxID=3143930 RepID=UPI003399E71D